MARGNDHRKFEDVYGHMQGHKVKWWLLKGTYKEDANTIRRAIKRWPSEVLIRRLARILTQED